MADDRRHAYQGSSARCWCSGWKLGDGRYKRGLNSKLRIVLAASATADCTQADALIEGLSAQYLLADQGYDSQALVEQATKQGMSVVIPSRKNRKVPRDYDAVLYRYRHLVENAFLHLKRWRGIATRYANNAASFLAAAQIRCIALWA